MGGEHSVFHCLADSSFESPAKLLPNANDKPETTVTSDENDLGSFENEFNGDTGKVLSFSKQRSRDWLS